MYEDIERRNFYFINELKRLGYKEIVVGFSKPHPFIDPYKDNNYIYGKLYGFLMNVKIKMPVAFLSKKKILKIIKEKSIINELYSCDLNNNDFKRCRCVKCKEYRKALG